MMKLNIQLFASGTITFEPVSNGKNAWIQGRIRWSSTKQGPTDNYSLCDFYLEVTRTDSITGNTQGANWKGSVTILDGAGNTLTPIYFTTSSNLTAKKGTWTTLKSVTNYKVPHAGDGSLSTTISGYVIGSPATSFNGKKTYGSSKVTFDTIARASTLDSFSGSKRIGVANDVTINFTKKNSSFTSTLEYATTSNFSDAVKIVDKSTNASTYSWTIPINLLNKIPNSKSLTIYIRLTTFNGTSQIGEYVDSSFTAQVYDDNCRPIFNTHTIEETDSVAKTLVTSANKFVANLSKPKFTFSASGQYGATISYYQINNTNRTSGFTDSSFNTNGYVLKVVDSRGVTNTYTFNLTYVPYFTPVFEEVNLFRDTPTSSKVFSTFKIKFFNNASSVKFDNPQALSYKFDYQENGGTAQEKVITPETSDSETTRTAQNETELGNTFNYKRSIDWTFTFKDLTGKTYITSNTLPMGVPLMNGKMENDGEQILYINGTTRLPQSPNSEPIGIGFGNNIVLRQSTDGDTVINGNRNLCLRPKGNTDTTGEAMLTQDGDLNITRNLNALNVLVSKFLKIPNGTQGGLCNQSDMPIIQDYNNQNITLNATGLELFLGFINTTAINMFNQVIKFYNNGNIAKRNSDGSYTNFALVSELLKMPTFSHGANWFHVRFSNGFTIVGGSGTAKSSGNTTINYGVTFSEAPIVLTQARTTNGGVTEIKLYSKGTASMQVVLGGSAISSVTCDWIAFGYIAS